MRSSPEVALCILREAFFGPIYGNVCSCLWEGSQEGGRQVSSKRER